MAVGGGLDCGHGGGGGCGCRNPEIKIGLAAVDAARGFLDSLDGPVFSPATDKEMDHLIVRDTAWVHRLYATVLRHASDINKKKDLRELSPVLGKLRELTLFRYKWKHNGEPDAGPIAQHLRAAGSREQR